MLIRRMKNKELNLLLRKVNCNQIYNLLREATLWGGDSIFRGIFKYKYTVLPGYVGWVLTHPLVLLHSFTFLELIMHFSKKSYSYKEFFLWPILKYMKTDYVVAWVRATRN